MRVTLRDIAYEVGVSIATVSRVLTNKDSGRVRPEVAAEIRRAATRMGYRSSALARGLRTQHTRILGFVSDVIATSPYAGRILLGSQEAARRYGYTLLTVNTEDDEEVEDQHLEALSSYHVDGYIYASMFNRSLTVPKRLTSAPTVIVDASSSEIAIPSVTPDEVKIGTQAAQALIEAGVTRILYVDTSADIVARQGRHHGFFTTIDNLAPQVDVSLLAVDDRIERAWEPLVSALGTDVDGVFCFNDVRAAMVYQACAAASRIIGHDLAVVSVDKSEITQHSLHPPPSSIALPHFEMGYWGCAKLISSIAGDSALTDDPILATLPGLKHDHVSLYSNEVIGGQSCMLHTNG
ncbi:MAG: LacI family DNA-binding transcriptional regulator [Actinomycetaceae bacterium]|nr:LacI family DNA-binding transcriptional regulator [Actinomycetaceae bacterium]